MGFRIVYGNSIGENGWPFVDDAGCTWVDIPGTDPVVRIQIQNGIPLLAIRAWVADWNEYIEPVRDADTACWTPTNSVSTSNHLGGTAVGINWRNHPFQVRGTLSATQMTTLREMLAFYRGVIFWGGDWTSPVDEMHCQMDYGSYQNPDVAAWVAKNIRPDGYSTFRRGGDDQPAPSGGLTPAVLSTVMAQRVSLARYAQLLPHLIACFHLADCGTVRRRAMMLGQLFAESGGLRWQEEIADGSAYEGRRDLGNTQPGDGRRFKGRDFIQITGRYNYTNLSRWAYDRGIVPTPTFFVDNPGALATDEYAFVGVVWYWTAARNMNAFGDSGDVVGATRAVNGGLNGLAERQAAYARAISAGNDLLDPTDYDPVMEMLMADIETDSWSIYATPGEPKIPLQNMLKAVDANNHREMVEALARRGDTDSLSRIVRTANGQGTRTDPATIAYATSILAEIKATTPDIWSAYLKRIGAVQ